MKQVFSIIPLLLFLFSTILIGCQAIGGIFKAGMWTGIIIVGLLIFIALYFLNRKK